MEVSRSGRDRKRCMVMVILMVMFKNKYRSVYMIMYRDDRTEECPNSRSSTSFI